MTSTGHSVNPDVRPVDYEIYDYESLCARVADLERLVLDNPMAEYIRAAQQGGFVIQLIPARLYKVPQEAE